MRPTFVGFPHIHKMYCSLLSDRTINLAFKVSIIFDSEYAYVIAVVVTLYINSNCKVIVVSFVVIVITEK